MAGRTWQDKHNNAHVRVIGLADESGLLSIDAVTQAQGDEAQEANGGPLDMEYWEGKSPFTVFFYGWLYSDEYTQVKIQYRQNPVDALRMLKKSMNKNETSLMCTPKSSPSHDPINDTRCDRTWELIPDPSLRR